jgi:hypothetical protein
MNALKFVVLPPLSAAFLLSALVMPGCAVHEASDLDRDEQVDREQVAELAFAGGTVANAVGAAGTAIVCNVVCVTVVVVAVVGTTAYIAYRTSQDRNRVPLATITTYRFNMDWVYAGAWCPAVSQPALNFLSDRYNRCLRFGGGLDACRARTYSEAQIVADCESARGGNACATEAYLASARTSDGTGRNVGVVSNVTSSNDCVANRTFFPERTDNASGCIAADRTQRCYSARHYPCAGVHTHGKLYENQWRSTRCVRREVKAVRCDGAFFSSGTCSGPTVPCGSGGPHTMGVFEYN